MNIKQRLITVRAMYPYCTITRKVETGEYRINIKSQYGGNEGTACYETDLESAIGTMHAMNCFYTERV